MPVRDTDVYINIEAKEVVARQKVGLRGGNSVSHVVPIRLTRDTRLASCHCIGTPKLKLDAFMIAVISCNRPGPTGAIQCEGRPEDWSAAVGEFFRMGLEV